MSYEGLVRVISGGQVGADIAGVRAAKLLGLDTGGVMPKNFKAKDGEHPEYAKLYGMKDHISPLYPPRTESNVLNSDGTIRLAYNFNSPGERCTMKYIRKFEKPHYDVDLVVPKEADHLAVAQWIEENEIRILNVAGNAEPRIEPWVEQFLYMAFAVCMHPALVKT